MIQVQETLGTPTHLAWLAGIIDGEGTIGAYYQGRRRGRRCVTPVLQVPSTTRSIVDRVRDIARALGIQQDVYCPKQLTKAGNQVYVWSLRRKRAVSQLLKHVEPYLVAKRYRAQLLIEICDTPSHYRHGTPAHVIEKAEQIRAFNQGNPEPASQLKGVGQETKPAPAVAAEDIVQV